MVETNIRPDFITVDGGEGGTGAAPLEYSNSVGVPLRDGLAFIVDCLTGFDLKKNIKVIASGKVLSGFHLIKNIALGADICCSARGMMLALGCIQALECNLNSCPTGVATQNPALTKGLIVSDKEKRIANYHEETVKSVVELLAASGLDSTEQLTRSHIHRRISATATKRYDEIFPYVTPGRLLEHPYPERFEQEMQESSSRCFAPGVCIAFYGPKLKEIPNE
jgi:glutamate synthase domain-containing protein 2